MRLMNTLADLINGVDLTRQWVEEPTRSLRFDFDSGSLSGACIGSRFDQLSWLGPADNRRKLDSKNILYVWHAKGLWVEVRDESITLLTFWFESPATDQTQPYSGRFVLRGKSFQIQPSSLAARVESLMGDPTTRTMYEEDDDAEVESLLYRIGGREYLFDFEDNKNLCSLSASNMS